MSDFNKDEIYEVEPKEKCRVVAEWAGWEYDEVFDCWHQPSGCGTTYSLPRFFRRDELAGGLIPRLPKGYHTDPEHLVNGTIIYGPRLRLIDQIWVVEYTDGLNTSAWPGKGDCWRHAVANAATTFALLGVAARPPEENRHL